MQSTADAARSIQATSAHVTFCGHIHQPALYSMSAAAKMTSFVPSFGVSVQLLAGRQWLAVLGSVGQPRDRNPAASFAMFDAASNEITYCRVPYDVEAAANRIRANGLPLWLADRLSGREVSDGDGAAGALIASCGGRRKLRRGVLPLVSPVSSARDA